MVFVKRVVFIKVDHEAIWLSLAILRCNCNVAMHGSLYGGAGIKKWPLVTKQGFYSGYIYIMTA